MSTERKRQTPDMPPRDDFAWPPTTDELDAIEVIMLPQRSDDAQRVLHRSATETRHYGVWASRLRSLNQRLHELCLPFLRERRMGLPQMHLPRIRVPRIAMPRVSVSRVSLPGASGFIAAVMVARSSRPEHRNGGDVAWGLALPSLLAIGVAVGLHVSEWRRTPEAANLAATIERGTLTAATSTPTQEASPPLPHVMAATTNSRMDAPVPLAMAAQVPSMTTMAPGVQSVFAAASPGRRTYALPTTSAETRILDSGRPARVATKRTTPATRLRERIDRDDTPWWGRRTRRAATMKAGAVSPPLRLPASYVQPRVVSSDDGRRVRGKVVLGVLVRPNGRVGKVNVVSDDVDRELERAAIAAVKQWRYRPALRDGVPTPARVKVVVNFG